MLYLSFGSALIFETNAENIESKGFFFLNCESIWPLGITENIMVTVYLYLAHVCYLDIAPLGLIV